MYSLIIIAIDKPDNISEQSKYCLCYTLSIGWWLGLPMGTNICIRRDIETTHSYNGAKIRHISTVKILLWYLPFWLKKNWPVIKWKLCSLEKITGHLESWIFSMSRKNKRDSDTGHSGFPAKILKILIFILFFLGLYQKLSFIVLNILSPVRRCAYPELVVMNFYDVLHFSTRRTFFFTLNILVSNQLRYFLYPND